MTRLRFIILFLFVATGISALSAFRHSTPTATAKHKLALLENDSYKKQWAVVDSLDKKGLPQSALEEVRKIYALAKRDNNGPQQIKAMMYLLKYNAVLKEEDYEIALNDLGKMADEAIAPQKQFIHSIIAEVYWGFYQTNRWKFQGRTTAIDIKNDDIRTWDIKTISQHITKHYLLSLTNAEASKKVDVASYRDILWDYTTARQLRPTVYDFLAHRALDFFKNTEFDIIKPAYTFTLDKEAFFGVSSQFTNQTISTSDSLSTKYYATRIFQELEKFHADDSDPSARITLEIERLHFVRTYSVHPNKDTLYFAALLNLKNKYKDAESSTEIDYEIAKVHDEIGNLYNPIIGDNYKNEKNIALQICDQAAKRFPKSYGADLCRSLALQIEQKSLSFLTDEVVPINMPSKVLITSKNVDKVYIRIIKPGWDFNIEERSNSTEEHIKKLLSYTPVRQWEQNLKDDGDHQTHNFELDIPALEAGYYIIIVGSDKDFKQVKNSIWYSGFGVSNISFADRRNWEEESLDITLAHRVNGTPLANVKAQVYYKEYNYKTSRYHIRKGEVYTSNEYGQFQIKSTTKDYRYIYLDFSLNGDRLNSDKSFYQYKRYKDKQRRTTTHFFTDRAIYRPGQIIYFKGIRLSADPNGENAKLHTGESVQVEFFDSNHQKIASLDLKTNEYGSFAGSFTAPFGVLNGSMRISDSYGSKYVQVEEYKRPKFEAEFDKVTGVYKLGQKIKVKGNAKAYAGSVIDGAKVSYRVSRDVYFPYYWYSRNWYYGGRSRNTHTEITFGEVKTDEEGKFEIEFEAIPDLSVDKKYRPAFSYSIQADITDITGETHSASTVVSVGYTAMVLSNGIPSDWTKSENKKYAIYANNLNGTPVNAKGKISIHQIEQPSTVYFNRKWEQADRFSMSKEEYYKTFPGHLYEDENDVSKWPVGKLVYEQNFNTEKNDSIDIKNLAQWKAGKYKVVMTAIDSFGVEVNDSKFFDLYDEADKTPAGNTPFFVKALNPVCEPGDQARFLISSAYPEAKILIETEEKNNIVSRKWITLKKAQQLITFPVEEKHRGNFVVHFMMINNNRFYNYDATIIVPHTPKMLDIEFQTFRNKLLPGEKEEWRLKIKGKKGDKVAAELLISMYDASLDAFASNSYYFFPHASYYSNYYWNTSFGFAYESAQQYQRDWNDYYSYSYRYFDRLEWFGYQPNYYRYGYYDYDSYGEEDRAYFAAPMGGAMDMVMSEKSAEEVTTTGSTTRATQSISKNKREYKDNNGKGDMSVLEDESGNSDNRNGAAEQQRLEGGKDIQIRTNLNETAFFFPQLQTNENGEVIVSFTAPEALTRWKVIALAHTKDLKAGTTTKELVTQKDLMLMPNAPRFFREGDKLIFSAKVSNISEKDLDGIAQLELFDPFTQKSLDQEFHNKKPSVKFAAKKGQSALLNWEIEIPEGIASVSYRVLAKAGSFSDGEEMAVPILTNRMLVTESLPLPIRKAGTKNFTFTKLVNSSNSKTLKHHKLTLEFTNNPAWYAIQALPYMMEYPYECAEQTFSRFYANSIAAHIANSSPKIKAVFDSWKSTSPEAFLSNLEKNQELKSLLLEETPWVLDAQNESERKKRVGLLFDLNRMGNELDRALHKLKKMQVSNGAWPWFPGMPESRYITQHIVTGMGHLDKLGVKSIRDDKPTWNMVKEAVTYLDRRVVEDYEYIKRHYPNYKNEQHISYDVIQFIYARSYFKDLSINKNLQEALAYYDDQAKKYWLNFGLYAQGMLSLGANRFDKKELAKDIVKSIREKAIHHEELGMYWKDNVVGYYWYQAPIETHALLIEMFDEVANDQESVEELKVWLLKNKQTSDWKTTKATAEACFALLLRGTDVLANEEKVEIKLDNKIIDPKALDAKVEAGTGYFKTSWSGDAIKPAMGNVSITKTNNTVSWGALYWQYFEQLDKITPHETPLKLNKKLFLVKNTLTGPVMTPVNEKTQLRPGDKVRVKIELRVDRAMEYVHMKDMRASCFEPINVFSQYKWQDGLGYFESTKDAATNFFFEHLPKGTHVFEYDLFVAQQGDFSNGITTIQCMYAPEFTSHSEGIRVQVPLNK